jgi:hypothetical protein
LLPALKTSDDVVYAAAGLLSTISLAPSKITDADTIYAATRTCGRRASPRPIPSLPPPSRSQQTKGCGHHRRCEIPIQSSHPRCTLALSPSPLPSSSTPTRSQRPMWDGTCRPTCPLLISTHLYCGPVLRHPAESLPAVDLGGRVWLGGRSCKGWPAAPAFGG